MADMFLANSQNIDGVVQMALIINIILSILSFLLAAFSIVFVLITLNQNSKILKQGQEQIEESKKQFIASKRLECQPYLQMELVEDWQDFVPQFGVSIHIEDDDSEPVHALCKIKNVGNGTATNLIFGWESKGPSSSDIIPFPINAIMNGAEYYFLVILEKKSVLDSLQIYIEWEFGDILGNSYVQKSTLYYEDDTLVSIDNNPPEFEGIVKYKAVKKDE